VLLYDSGEFKLSEAKELPTEKRKEIAQKDYKHWFGKGASFFIDTFHALERKDFNKGAFELHQATESFYSTILLVFTGYKPKLHDILQLSQMARSYNHELFKIFPCETDEQKKCFELLAKAYIDARYNYEYRVTKEELLYLIERVKKLQKVTEKICLENINREIA
jgi:HEPN domain-containing protein